MSRLLLALLLTGLMASTVALPASAQTALEIANDLSRQAAAEDRKLNDLYKSLSASLKPKAKQALTRSELAWIKFRDAEVAAEADMWRGGTHAQVQALITNLRLLKQRASQLEHWLVQVTNDDDGWTPKEMARMVSEQRGAHAQADHHLNDVYKDYLSLNDAENRALMTKAELAWIRFRDLEVDFAALAARRPTEATYGKAWTLTDLTGARAEELGAIVTELKSH